MPRWTEERKAAIDAVMRDTIYGATVQVLKEYGIEGITMDRVAATGKLAKGTLYNYYRNKEELLELTHQRLIEPVLQLTERVAASARPADEKLREITEQALLFCEDNRVTLTLFQESGLSKQKDPAVSESFVGLLQQILEEGMSKGIFRRSNPRRMAEMMYGAMVAFFEFRLRRAEPIALEADLATFTSFYLKGITA